MTTKLAEWASELRQITKIRPSDSSGGKTFQRRCNLGTVGADLKVIWEMSVQSPSTPECATVFRQLKCYPGYHGLENLVTCPSK